MRGVTLCLLIVCGGCGSGTEPADAWPRLLTLEELTSYHRAEAALHLTDASLEDARALCTLQRDTAELELAEFGFTAESYLEVAELVFFARHGREVFAGLPRKKRALARELLKLCQGPEHEDLRKRLEEELKDQELAESPFVMTVLANAHVLTEYERKRRGAGDRVHTE